MLSAILHGKGRRLPTSLPAGASLKMAFVRSEDILTSTVFERLAYLDCTTLWNLLAATFKPQILAERTVAVLESLEFWPTWGQAKATLGKAVEPDVVMRFSVGDPAKEVVLIFECKLGGLQYPEQWAQEWIAFKAEDTAEDPATEICLLALGGFASGAEASVINFVKTLRDSHGLDVKAAAADWRDLLRSIDRINDSRSAERRILADIRAALALHGYSHFKSMSELAVIAYTYRIRLGAEDALRGFGQQQVLYPPLVENTSATAINDRLLAWPENTVCNRLVTEHECLRPEEFQ